MKHWHFSFTLKSYQVEIALEIYILLDGQVTLMVTDDTASFVTAPPLPINIA